MQQGVIVNGDAHDFQPGMDIAGVVATLASDPGLVGGGVAVAVNGVVVPRGQWTSRAVEPGDRIEIVTAVQGG
jgi:sulfur carrier protein